MASLKLSKLQQQVSLFQLTPNTTLQNRIMFQKSIYILQELGALQKSYPFNWYVFGPYSPPLARVGFDFAEEGRDVEIQVTPSFNEKLKIFQEIYNEGKSDKWLELLSCIIYQRKIKRLEKKEMFKLLKEHQTYFADEGLLEHAWNTIDKFFKF